jgi:CelD/BcsL family acetyltransferase involved in cellulose biosynthesis
MQVCRLLGAEEADLVPFEKYAAATRSLKSPSSAARALANGACDIERVDRLVQRIAAQFEMDSRVVNETVALVDERLRGNRKAAFPAQVSGGGDRTNGASIPRGEREDVRFEWLGIDEATPQFVAHWHDLGLAASTPNIYLMPEFVLPAIRYLDTDKAPRFAALWNANRSALVALGVFNAVRPSWRFPFARLSAVRSKHSFQSGVLMRAGIDARAMDHFIDGLFGSSWRAVRFNELREDSFAFRQLLESAQRRGLRWLVDRRYERAAVELAPNSAWRKYIPHSRHRRLRRARAKLEELGHVEFRVVQGSDVSDGNADAFLRLESMGWKKKSVLLATSQETLFFREMMHACRERGLVFFCELLLDGTVIASTSNFQINGSGFAFKVGNDPAYAKLSPGLLVEYAFLESSAEMCPKLREIESGAQAGSFIELLWPDRIPIVSGHLLAGPLPTAYAFMKQHLKTARRLITRR